MLLGMLPRFKSTRTLHEESGMQFLPIYAQASQLASPSNHRHTALRCNVDGINRRDISDTGLL